MRAVITAILALSLLLGASAAARADEDPKAALVEVFGRLAIQEQGRVKPVDTFAREQVRILTGKESFRGEDPVWTLLRWMADPQAAIEEANIELRNLKLKQSLGLAPEGRWFSLAELAGNPGLREIRQRIMARHQSGEKLQGIERDEEQLLMRLHGLQALTSGEALTIVPHPAGLGQPWSAVVAMDPAVPYPQGLPARATQAYSRMLEGVHRQDLAQALAGARALAATLPQMGPYPSQDQLEREIGYNRLHPFRLAWVLYLLGLLLLIGAGMAAGPLLYRGGLALVLAGFAMHAYGFWLRCTIAGRPPVTNMYESVVWVSLGAMAFALIFEALYRSRTFLMAACSVAIVGLVLADNLPAVLDPSIHPLTPVLRNNFWLTVHVLTITLGYAAFLLATGLGHMCLWHYLTGPDRRERLRGLTQALYRSLQVGVLLLAAGTILGGVWAAYSWGRFWGWDPKEVWALIALLGYLALLHGRFTGWIGPFGLAAGSVVAFMLVLMAWYGVNFVLGQGLHSYGFGNGGAGYVAGFAAADLAFVALVAWRYNRYRAEGTGRQAASR